MVQMCRNPTVKICDEHQLALSGILLLDIDQTLSILEHMDYLNAYKEMDSNYAKFTAGGHGAWIQDVYENLHLIRTAATASFNTCVNSSTLPFEVKSILHSLKRTYSRQYSIKGVNENTIIKDHLVPILDSFFPNDDYLTTYAADKEIAESSIRFTAIDPSLQKHAKKADYSVVHNPTKFALLTVEAKSCQNQSKSSSDVVKIGKYLKDLLDAAEAKGYQGLQLLGLVSRGDQINVYVVEHKYDCIYTMFKLNTLHIPIKYTDIHRAISAFEILSRLKQIVDYNVDIFEQAKDARCIAKD
ncbi:hypothetical protein MUCCIDRAFT_76290 [Mucor lusitanicus CBS 277.49]|uniref:Fungal-type protein kinase domain-containing protein n=1 Tax=Mucor lusitanicus CBS 277.49 TaxID=747725 RepID=A0A162RUE3_MUCCL|nr:hypothetical protein MUCCIDRAFT_76290 [Mucor lusitanicus CBS 277.49]